MRARPTGGIWQLGRGLLALGGALVGSCQLDDDGAPAEVRFFVDAKINGAGCGYRTSAHAPTYHDYSTGFRCCSAAE